DEGGIKDGAGSLALADAGRRREGAIGRIADLHAKECSRPLRLIEPRSNRDPRLVRKLHCLTRIKFLSSKHDCEKLSSNIGCARRKKSWRDGEPACAVTRPSL